MDANEALKELLERVEYQKDDALISFHETELWDAKALQRLLKYKLLTPTTKSSTIICDGCEIACFKEVVFSSDQTKRAFVICQEPEKQEFMGRISVSPKRLKQWKASLGQLAIVLVHQLDLPIPETNNSGPAIKLGMLKGSKGRRWITLTAQPLALEINQESLLISELLYFDDDELKIDRMRIDDLLNSEPKDTSKTYTPNTNKRESRKLLTQAMYQDWKEEYKSLKQKHPKKSDKWCSIEISKMNIAQGRDSETIRKKMKK